MRVAAVAFALLALAGPARATGSFDHSAWDTLLQRWVDDAGRVAYQNWEDHDLAPLDGYLAALAAADPDKWPREEQIAFWINAYNASLVRAVMDGYSAENSVQRYRIFSERTQEIAGRPRTADEIEKRILHDFKEPRVHFAIACAAVSCPTLRRRAWTGDTLNADLEEATRQFLADPVRNHIKIGDGTVRLSAAFKWYQADFGGTDETVLAWVGKHVDDATHTYLDKKRPAVDYLLYDWALNAQPKQRPS